MKKLHINVYSKGWPFPNPGAVSYPVCPRTVAWCSGPLPFMSLMFTFAPFCSKNSQVTNEPYEIKAKKQFST